MSLHMLVDFVNFLMLPDFINYTWQPDRERQLELPKGLGEGEGRASQVWTGGCDIILYSSVIDLSGQSMHNFFKQTET